MYQNHVNQDGLHVHGDLKTSDRSAFIVHLSQKIKDFVMEQLHIRLIVSQIMAKHTQHAKNIMLGSYELNINMFLTEQNVKVLPKELIQKNTNYVRMMQKVCACGFNKTLI
jgi:hypothetical protein